MSAHDADGARPDARAAVLAAVREALVDSPDAEPVPRTYRRAGERSADAGDDVGHLLDLLVERLEDYRATVVRCAHADVRAAVAAQLEGVGSVVVPPGLPAAWAGAPGDAGAQVRVDSDAQRLTHAELDATGAVLTACRAAVAETGTIVLDAEPDQGRRAITLLPDRHVCVVRADQVVTGVPDAVAVLAEHPTRPLTWVSGPSATSDIELVRVEGVHGPRDLRVVVVDPA
ncbi:LUD domain-containing protein [Actinotalea sp. AC32]|nr:LUD domain-containing protein [Actinotalea sp. AC32]